jgi:hypothetical protein
MAILKHRVGEYESSEFMASKVIRGYQKAMGATHPETSYALLILGTSLFHRGELQMAKAKIIIARDMSHRLLGPGSPVAVSAERQLEAIRSRLDGTEPAGVPGGLMEVPSASLTQQWRQEIAAFQSAHGEEELHWLPNIGLKESAIEGE